MIRINLLPVKQARQNADAVTQILAIALVIVASLVAVYVVWSLHEDQKSALQRRVTKAEEEIERLDKIIGEVNRFTTTKKALEAKLDVITSLKKRRQGPVQAMDDLSQRIPTKVWLTSYSEGDSSVIMEGLADSEEDVALFLAELERSQYFSSVVLNYTQSEVGGAEARKKFRIACRVRYALQ